MILKGDGKEFDIPLFVHEIPLPRYIAFGRARQRHHDALAGEDAGEIRDALLEVLPTLVDGDLSSLPFYEKHEGDNFRIGPDYRGVLSLWHIYAHLLNMIDSYQIDTRLDYSFEWLGGTYFVEPDRARRLLLHKSYTAGEVIELNEFRRKADAKTRHNAKKTGFDTEAADAVLGKEGKAEKLMAEKAEALRGLEAAGDPNGNLAFMLSKRQMAVLARKEGERLPLNKAERDAFLTAREKLFSEITLDIYLDVRFFLLAILKGSKSQRTTAHSSGRSRNRFTAARGKGSPTRRRRR